jgi:hypothetical protein
MSSEDDPYEPKYVEAVTKLFSIHFTPDTALIIVTAVGSSHIIILVGSILIAIKKDLRCWDTKEAI